MLNVPFCLGKGGSVCEDDLIAINQYPKNYFLGGSQSGNFLMVPPLRPPVAPHAPKGQRTLFEVGCTKRKREASDGQPAELRQRVAFDVAQRMQSWEAQAAGAHASKPLHPRPVGKPRNIRAPAPKQLWFQPSCKQGVSLHLHTSDLSL